MLFLADHHCVYCDKPIGLYESVWAELASGPVEFASALDLTVDQLRDGVRLRHFDCGPAAEELRPWHAAGAATP